MVPSCTLRSAQVHTETFNECSVSPSSTQLNTGTFRYLSSPLRQTEGLTEAFPNSLSPLRVIVDCVGPQREFYRLLWYSKVCFSPYSAFIRIFCCTRSAHVHIEDFRDSQSSLRSKQRCSGSLEVFQKQTDISGTPQVPSTTLRSTLILTEAFNSCYGASCQIRSTQMPIGTPQSLRSTKRPLQTPQFPSCPHTGLKRVQGIFMYTMDH